MTINNIIFIWKIFENILNSFNSTINEIENLEDLIKLALKEIVGAYGIVIICHDDPDKIIAARNGSPLVVGLGKNENYVASDTSAIIDYTRNILFLEDGEIIELEKKSYKIKHIDHDDVINKEIKKIEYSLEAIEKGEYEHFMLKEIFQQPLSIADSYRGRILKNKSFKHVPIEDILVTEFNFSDNDIS